MRLIILCCLAVLPGLVIGQDSKLRNTAETKVVLRTSCGLATASEPPLFIVDGVVEENISHLKGEDIESILVFRDTVFFHSSGRGIIVITTKRNDSKLAVVDAENSSAIPFVYVQVGEEEEGMMLTGDGKGRVDLKHLEKGRVYKLKISSVGYETQELDYEPGAGPAVVKMKKDFLECSSVVVEARVQTWKCGVNYCIAGCTAHRSDTDIINHDPIVKVFPNPAKAGSSVHVKIESSEEEERTIHLLDMSGRICMVKTIKAIKGNNNAVFQLDTRLAAGIYVISITTEKNKKPFTQKLLIQ